MGDPTDTERGEPAPTPSTGGRKKKKKKSKRVQARSSRGLRDLLPELQMERQRLIDGVRGVYERYGFSPLATPAVEYLDVLLGAEPGDEATSQIFTASNPEGEALGLRFDLTVPLARVVAQHRDLSRPFRRYQVAQVWRGDKPDKGRYREFTQFDIDSVGAPSHLADVEIMAAMCDTLEVLEVGPYRVRFSSRTLLDSLLDFARIPRERDREVFRVLDKLDKLGLEKVELELSSGYVDASGSRIPGLGLEEAQVAKIRSFLTLGGDGRADVLGRLRDLFASVDGAEAAIDGVEEISDRLASLGYGDDRVALDVSIARGLAYYTGPVFEAGLIDAPQFGTVFAGGRYDGLVKRFLGEAVPAVGASMGIDRLLAALEHLGRLRRRKSMARVLVARMDPALDGTAVEIAFSLRRAGIPTELFLGRAKNVGKQLKHADHWEIPLVVLVGEDELAQGVVTLKDMDVGRRISGDIDDRDAWLARRPGQRLVERTELVEAVRRLLDEIDRDDAGPA